MTASAKLDRALALAVHKASDGWAAGIVLMREHLARQEAGAPEALLPEGKEAVFQYFTGEIFGRAREENQRVLMLSALLPSVAPSDAVAVSGNPEAPLVLDYVYRRHLFTDRRRSGSEPVYSFHALFREFLLAEGRRQALTRWLAAMPAELRESEPRLLLGEAYAVLYDEPARAKALLDPGPEYLATADALRIRGALLIALLFRQPAHRRIGACRGNAARRARRS